MLKWVDPKIAIGFLTATLFWICALGWQSSYAPTEQQKQECYETAKRTGRQSEECKSVWERTTSDPIALYGFGTFIFTAVVGVSTVFLWFATSGTAAIANRALMATHRPRIGIRRLELNLLWESNEPAEARFIIVNKGASTARVKSAHGILYFRSPESGPDFRYVFDSYTGTIEGCPTVLPAGASFPVKIRSNDTKETANQRLGGKWFIYATGQIVYDDETGTQRTTAFLREFRTGLDWSFRPVNDPEYEYED
jgi:hypothetical protein